VLTPVVFNAVPQPTPLYVMDEIDAALDFKNVSIVANYIKDRTKNAQFVIISLRYVCEVLCLCDGAYFWCAHDGQIEDTGVHLSDVGSLLISQISPLVQRCYQFQSDP
jgi:ABC-type multidrug transport system ATPase subunit